LASKQNTGGRRKGELTRSGLEGGGFTDPGVTVGTALGNDPGPNAQKGSGNLRGGGGGSSFREEPDVIQENCLGDGKGI